jgi:hypothetical protein
MKNVGGHDAGGGEKHPGTHEKRRQRRRSGVSSGQIALVLAVVGLVLIVLFIIPRGQNRSVDPLSRSMLTMGTPINSTDPTSGKPVVAGITSVYKGYTIGHCCEVSKQEWEALSIERKEAYVRQFRR